MADSTPTSPGTPSLPSVAVVIPTHGRPALLEDVVTAVLADEATTELIVVVDGSRDGSVEILERMAAADARLHPIWVEHGGQHRACHAGVVAATSEIVLMLDDDVIADLGLVSGHARAHLAGPRQVVVGYMPTPIRRLRDPADVTTLLYSTEYEALCTDVERDPGQVLARLWFGNLSMHRDDCLRVGLCSPDYPDLYHQDTDFGLRCRRAGLSGVFDRSLSARHVHRRSLESFFRDARAQGAGQCLLHRLHPELGELDLDEFAAGLPGPARWLVRASRDRRVGDVLRRVVRGTADVLGRIHCFGLELRVVKLGRRLEQQWGALRVATGVDPASFGRAALGSGAVSP